VYLAPAHNLTIRLLDDRLYGPGRYRYHLLSDPSREREVHAADRRRATPPVEPCRPTRRACNPPPPIPSPANDTAAPKRIWPWQTLPALDTQGPGASAGPCRAWSAYALAHHKMGPRIVSSNAINPRPDLRGTTIDVFA
jgi:hypothetical protein